MKIVHINMLHMGSTGKIMFGIADVARQIDHEVWTFSPRYYHKGKKLFYPEIENHRYFGSRTENMIHHHIARLIGLNGCFSYFGTKELLQQLDSIRPDIIHLHNLHNWTINLASLFRYIKRNNIKTIWTLHDCWSFTGQCPHFTLAQCDKWKNGCHHCEHVCGYLDSIVHLTSLMWKWKKKWFTGVKDLTIVTPSHWLADLVGMSFLKEYPVHVVNNGIDLSVFHPVKSDFKKKYKCVGKHVVLGVAFGWDERKGLDVFIELAQRLGKQYQVVLVGTNDDVDKQLPDNIISIHRTQDQKELAEIYSAADVFVNPTREEVLGLVNIEALACGTPVIAFRSGGVVECFDHTCGIGIEVNGVDAMGAECKRVCEQQVFSSEECCRFAKSFDDENKYMEYVQLYEK